MKPIVYVETNWIIACLLPHDQSFEKAINLIALATNGICELRIPQIAFIEAEGTMKSRVDALSNELIKVEDQLQNARKSGFDIGTYTRQGATAYLQQDRQPILDSLKSNPAISIFVDPIEEITEIGRAKPELKFSTKDMKDLYILCAILVDRRKQNQSRPALFMNENHKEFSDEKKKVPPEFYDKHRLLYWRGFDGLTTAVGKWTSKYPNL